MNIKINLGEKFLRRKDRMLEYSAVMKKLNIRRAKNRRMFLVGALGKSADY